MQKESLIIILVKGEILNSYKIMNFMKKLRIVEILIKT